MKIDGKTYVRPNYKGKKAEKIIIDAAENGCLDAWCQHPITKKMIKVPANLISRMRLGESFSIEEIEENSTHE